MGRRSGFSRRALLQGVSAALCLPRSAHAASLIRQPYLQNVQADRASVLWTTDQPDFGTVTAIGDDGSTVTAAASIQTFQPAVTGLDSTYYQYQADLLGLNPHTNYTYTVMAGGQTLASDPTWFQFRTAGSGNFSFLVFGDSGSLSTEQLTLINLMNAEPHIAFAIHAGDLAYPDGSFAEFEANHFAPNAPLMRRLCFFETPGNHEYLTESAAPYLAGVAQPDSSVPASDVGRYYSFDWGHAHFVSVDSNNLMGPNPQQMLDWLDADLAATTKRWRIVFLHHPPYPSGYHLNDPICAAVAQMVVPIVERHGVQLVLSGHEHGYERSFPLQGGVPVDPPSPSTLYMITGGGGGNLESVGSIPQCALSIDTFHYLRVEVTQESIRLTATGLDGQPIDEVKLGPAHMTSIHRVLSAGSYTRAVAAGSLVAITGEHLAPHTVTAPGVAQASSLDGVVVTVNGAVAPLRSVSPQEINAQLPDDVFGLVELRVLTPEGSASANVTVLAAAPSLVGVRSANKPLHFSNPVRPGARVSLYLTGLGSLAATSGLEVWLGNHRLELVSTAPALSHAEAGRPGVSRVDVTVPANLEDGLYALQVVAGTVSSRPTNVDISATDTRARHDRAILKVEVRNS
jgi:uncharacterized protein (TIGR03437 family)